MWFTHLGSLALLRIWAALAYTHLSLWGWEVSLFVTLSFTLWFLQITRLLLSYSDRSGTVRHLITILRMVCKWKLKNCSFLEFFPSVFVGQGWLWVTGTVETRGTRCSIAQKSGLLRARLGGIVESWWRNMGMVRPLLGKAQWQWRVRKGEIFRW